MTQDLKIVNPRTTQGITPDQAREGIGIINQMLPVLERGIRDAEERAKTARFPWIHKDHAHSQAEAVALLKARRSQYHAVLK